MSREFPTRPDVRPVEGELFDLPRPPVIASPDKPPVTTAATTGRIFELHPAAATLAVVGDLFTTAMNVSSICFLMPVCMVVAVMLGVIVYRIQRGWCGDSHDVAMTKALIVGVITVIPVPVTPFFAVPAGIVGLIRRCQK